MKIEILPSGSDPRERANPHPRRNHVATIIIGVGLALVAGLLIWLISGAMRANRAVEAVAPAVTASTTPYPVATATVTAVNTATPTPAVSGVCMAILTPTNR